jgi:predicted kinase
VICLVKLNASAVWQSDTLVLVTEKQSIEWTSEQIDILLKTTEIWVFGNSAWMIHDQLDDLLLSQARKKDLPITNAVVSRDAQAECLVELLGTHGEKSVVVLFDFSASELAKRILFAEP